MDIAVVQNCVSLFQQHPYLNELQGICLFNVLCYLQRMSSSLYALETLECKSTQNVEDLSEMGRHISAVTGYRNEIFRFLSTASAYFSSTIIPCPLKTPFQIKKKLWTRPEFPQLTNNLIFLSRWIILTTVN